MRSSGPEIAGPDTERTFAGDAVFLGGRFASVPMLVLHDDVAVTLVDGDGRAVNMRLPGTGLPRTHTDGVVDQYGGAPGTFGVFPVVDPTTCVGVRQERSIDRAEWVIGEISRDAVSPTATVSGDSAVHFNVGRRLMVDEDTLAEEIVFYGYADGQRAHPGDALRFATRFRQRPTLLMTAAVERP
mgnify:CR=1 FL=1